METFRPMLTEDECSIIVVDEGDEATRRKNDAILADVCHAHYGPREREEWFKRHFGSNFAKYLTVIPERCHAETSFGFLVAYEEAPDLVIELDDDVFPWQKQHIVKRHAENIFGKSGSTVSSEGRFYNTIENLRLNVDTPLFARGHPYAEDARRENYVWKEAGGKCALNMGLWAEVPDYDALTILYYGGLNGRCRVEGAGFRRGKVIVSEGTFFPVCSMNTSFVPEAVPAFYQLYMNCMGIDRFDDIWSGLFFKKVADRLSEKVCLGIPIVRHEKRPRDTFRDLEKELNGMAMNEKLWRLVADAEIEGETFFDAYDSLIIEMEAKMPKYFEKQDHIKFLKLQTEKMRLWLKTMDRLR
jgi:hypothetical protein